MVMPYYKYLMEYLEINYFICIGILAFTTAYYSKYFKELITIDKNGNK